MTLGAVFNAREYPPVHAVLQVVYSSGIVYCGSPESHRQLRAHPPFEGCVLHGFFVLCYGRLSEICTYR